MFETVNVNEGLVHRFKENLRSKKSWRYFLAIGLRIAAGTCILLQFIAIPLLLEYEESSPFAPEGYLMLFPIALDFLCILLLFASGYFLTSWKHCQELTVTEAMEKDPRPPIFYLRPFKADKLSFRTLESSTNMAIAGMIGGIVGLFLVSVGFTRKKKGEELIVEVLDEKGPVVAIGRPGERIPPVGAARLYVGDEWKDVARDFMKKSQLIVLFAGTTPNFAWEIGEVFRNAPFAPTVLLLPFFSRYKEEEVRRFVELFSEASGLSIPRDLRKIRAMYFPARGTSIPIEDLGTTAERELNKANPFLCALGRLLHLGNPEWVEEYGKSVRENNRLAQAAIRKLCFAIIALSAMIFLFEKIIG